MKSLYGLYAITDTKMLDDQQLLVATQQAIEGGARIIQYRNKTLPFEDKQRQGHKLVELCHRHNIPLIINDDIKLAATVGADGVHLGKDDGEIGKARAKLGDDIIVGVSCYNEAQRAKAAVEAGASYIAFGAFFPSATKPNAPKAEPHLLAWAKQELNIPIVAIGGVTPLNGATLVRAGANMLAVIQGVFGQTDICAAAQKYANLFSKDS